MRRAYCAPACGVRLTYRELTRGLHRSEELAQSLRPGEVVILSCAIGWNTRLLSWPSWRPTAPSSPSRPKPPTRKFSAPRKNGSP